jgi:hypothetical protein
MGTRSPENTESVAALAAQVADLRGQVVGLRARVENAGMQSGIRLAEQVADLARTVADLVDEGTVPRISAPTWVGLDPEQRAAQLAELTEWVTGFLVMNYPHVTIRPCWADHQAALWELSTLRAEWRRVYERKRPDLSGALDWHDRHLPGVALRVEKILKDCKGSCALAKSPAPVPLRPRPRAG